MGCSSRSRSGSSRKPEETEEQQRGYSPHNQSEPSVDNEELCPGKCITTHIYSNPFLNFLRIYRQKHAGWSATKLAVEGARVWSTMSPEKKEKFKRVGRAATVANKAKIKVEKQYGRRRIMKRRTRHSRKRMRSHERRMRSRRKRSGHRRRGRRRTQSARRRKRRRSSSSSRSRSRRRRRKKRRRSQVGRHRRRGASRKRRRTRSKRRRKAPRGGHRRRKSRRRRRR